MARGRAASLLSQKSLDGSFPFPCPFPCPGPDPGNVRSHDRLRWVFGAPSGTGTGTGTGTKSEAFFGLMALAVNGTLMRGLELNGNLLAVGATVVREARTAPAYRLWSIGDRHAAMIRVAPGGAAIAVEV